MVVQCAAFPRNLSKKIIGQVYFGAHCFGASSSKLHEVVLWAWQWTLELAWQLITTTTATKQ